MESYLGALHFLEVVNTHLYQLARNALHEAIDHGDSKLTDTT